MWYNLYLILTTPLYHRCSVYRQTSWLVIRVLAHLLVLVRIHVPVEVPPARHLLIPIGIPFATEPFPVSHYFVTGAARVVGALFALTHDSLVVDDRSFAAALLVAACLFVPTRLIITTDHNDLTPALASSKTPWNSRNVVGSC